MSIWGWKVVDSDVFVCFLWDRKPSEPRLLLVELETTLTNHSLQQNVGSSYWSVLNFFGPTGLLKTRKWIKTAVMSWRGTLTQITLDIRTDYWSHRSYIQTPSFNIQSTRLKCKYSNYRHNILYMYLTLTEIYTRSSVVDRL